MARRKSSSLRDPNMVVRLWNELKLAWQLMRDTRVSLLPKLIPAATILYILSPLDLIPEIVFGPFGVLDDIGTLLLGLQLFVRSVPQEIVREYRDGRARGGAIRYNTSQVIEGEYEVQHE